VKGNSPDCHVTVLGAGPYGLAASAYLRANGVEFRVFGQPMAFWQKQMPVGMCLRSNWGASHIADPNQALTLDEYSRQFGGQKCHPIPLDRFVAYGHWFQRQVVPDLDHRFVQSIDKNGYGLKLTLSDGSAFTSKRVVVAAGISSFAALPAEFAGLPSALASHTSEHDDLRKFKGKKVAIIGLGQSALESAALLYEAGIEPEVIGRQDHLNWVGRHYRLHRLGLFSKMMYSKRDVGPAGISRLVAAPHLFRRLPRKLQNPIAYRAVRPAGAGWLQPRLTNVHITLGRKVVSAAPTESQLRLKLDDGSERMVDHVLCATGFRVNVKKYPFLGSSILQQLETANGYPILRRGLESSVSGLHFLGKPAAWSLGPLLGFVSGAEFACTEMMRSISNGASRTQ